MTAPKAQQQAKPAKKGTSEVLKFDKSKSANRGTGKAGGKAKKTTHRAPGSTALAKREEEPFRLGTAGLVVIGNPTFEQYSAYWQNLHHMANSAQWAVGDLINYGETRADWGEMYAQVIDETKRSIDSLMSYRNIAKKFPEDRRRPALSFGHHRLVAPMQEIEQDKWLDLAEKEMLSVKQLAERIKDKNAKTTPSMFSAEDDAPPVASVVIVNAPGQVAPRVNLWATEALADRDAAMINRAEGNGKIIAVVIPNKSIQDLKDADGDPGDVDDTDPPL